MPHHPDDIKQIEKLQAERQSLYDELAEIFDKSERQMFLDSVGTWYKTEEEALKRFNEIKQGLRGGKRIRNVSNSTFNKNEYVTKVKQADVLNTEIDYLQIPRGLREKYPKVNKWTMSELYKFAKERPETFKERFNNIEDFFKDAAEVEIEEAFKPYPFNMMADEGSSGKDFGTIIVKDKALKTT